MTEALIDNFIDTHDFPIMEGSSVTFIFRGEVDEVHLQHWVFSLETRIPLHRLSGTDLWYLTFDFPECSRIEYKFDIAVNGKHRWVHDPFNPQTAWNPFGVNSVCCTPGYETPDWTLPDPESRSGSLEHFRLFDTVFGGEREINVYLPARFRNTRKYPLLIAHDGLDYLRYASFRTVLDNLIHRLEIPPMIVVLTQAGDRLQEYAADPTHSDFIVKDVLPFVEERFPLSPHSRHRGMMGAGFGAVASLYTAWRHQGVFDRLLLQSGSFVFTDIGQNSKGSTFDPVVSFVNQLRNKPGKPARKLFISCGTFESLIYENRSLVPILQAGGLRVKYTEARDGHNWENWRDRLRQGLSWLFPGPLMMIYE